jgi:hypothetical protein
MRFRTAEALPPGALLVLLAFNGSLAAQTPSLTYLQGAVESPGANGAYFSSTLVLTNLGADPATIFPSVLSVPGTFPPPIALRQIAPGETLVVPHILSSWFGGAYKAGTLELNSNPFLLARLETANIADPSATYGVGMTPVREMDALAAGQTGQSAWVSVSADPGTGYRTNVSVTFLDANGSATVEIHDDQGTLRGATTLSADTPRWIQLSVADLIGPGALPLGRAALHVTAGRAIGMTIVNDNVTSDGIASPFERVPTGLSDLLLDGVAHAAAPDGTRWSTDLRLLNPGPEPITVSVAARGFVSVPVPISRTIPSGGLIEIDDVLGPAGFGAPDGAAGALRIQALGPVLASARTKNTDPGGLRAGTFSGFQAAVPWSTGFLSAPDLGTFTGLDQTTAVPGFRTNLALLGGDIPLTSGMLVLRDRAGNQLAASPFSLGNGEWTQKRLDAWFPGVPPPAGARVDLVVASGMAHGYASRIDNGSGDPVILPVAVLPGDALPVAPAIPAVVAVPPFSR